MILKRRKLGLLLAVMMTLTMTAPIVFGQGKDWSDDNEKNLVGAWRTAFSVLNCQTGDTLASGHGLFTFNKGGTMSEFGIGPGATPALRSPGHGVWQRDQGRHDYSITFTFYRYDATGVFIGSQRVRATLHLGGDDEFVTRSSIDILDANDNLVSSGCGRAVGTRFE